MVAISVLLFGFTGATNASVMIDEIHDAAPHEYTVQKGDTLWAISGKYLKSPWNWRQLWEANQTTIANPDLIYPGDILFLQRVNGKASLRRKNTGNMNDAQSSFEVRLKPGMRLEDASGSDGAIASFSFAAVDKFLARPALVQLDQFNSAPRVVAAESGKIFAGAGSKIYSKGLAGKPGAEFTVFRQGTPLVDPDSNETLANEAISLGTVRLLQQGDLSTLEVLRSTQEITLGDRLLPVQRPVRFDSPIQPASASVFGKIIKVYDERSSSLLADSGVKSRSFDIEGGRMSIVVINKGTRDHLEEGNVLVLNTLGKMVGRSGSLGFINGEKSVEPFKLPDQATGQLIVFRAFERLSYALVVKAEKPVTAGDGFKGPDAN